MAQNTSRGRVLARRLWLACPPGLRRTAVTRLNDRFTVAVLGVFFDPRGRVLLLRHLWHARDGWALPSGFIEARETPEAGLLRELREETGLEGEDLHLLEARTIAARKHLELFFWGSVATPEPVTLNYEIREAGWFAPDALPAGLSEAHRGPIAEARTRVQAEVSRC